MDLGADLGQLVAQQAHLDGRGHFFMQNAVGSLGNGDVHLEFLVHPMDALGTCVPLGHHVHLQQGRLHSVPLAHHGPERAVAAVRTVCRHQQVVRIGRWLSKRLRL